MELENKEKVESKEKVEINEKVENKMEEEAKEKEIPKFEEEQKVEGEKQFDDFEEKFLLEHFNQMKEDAADSLDKQKNQEVAKLFNSMLKLKHQEKVEGLINFLYFKLASFEEKRTVRQEEQGKEA